MKRRTIMVDGEARQVATQLARRFEVVRGILTNELTLSQGARRLRMRRDALEQLVEGARRKILAMLAIPAEIMDGSSITRMY